MGLIKIAKMCMFYVNLIPQYIVKTKLIHPLTALPKISAQHGEINSMLSP